MVDMFGEIGFARWPLVFSSAAVVGLASYSAARLFGRGALADPMSKAVVDAILLWGAFATVAGVLSTLVGIVTATRLAQAAAVSASVLWGGVRVSMLGVTFGVLILAGSSLAWFVLQFRWRLLEAAEAQAADPGPLD
ncbi:MAG: hypothetical protein IIB36_14085 [Gemmatimonadetes bacterium]|nr:hypothetical protein [Gemmatimonadota bacterium]